MSIVRRAGRRRVLIPVAIVVSPLAVLAVLNLVLGDNRTYSQDSRDFGPVPRDAIFALVVLVVWPFGRFGVPRYHTRLVPPCGPLC